MARHPEKMRDVDQTALQAFDGGAIFQITGNRRFPGCCNGMNFKICRKKTDLSSTLCRSQKEILVFVVLSTQCPDDVSGIGTYAKLVHPSNIDGDLHGRIKPQSIKV